MIRLSAAALLAVSTSAAFASMTVPSAIVPQFSTAAQENLHIGSLAALGEARLGDRGIGGATYEVDVQDHSRPTFSPAADMTTAHKVWTNGVYENFALSYTASTRTVAFTVGSSTATRSMANVEGFSDVWIRLFAQQSNSLTSAVQNVAVTTNFGSGVETRGLSLAAHAAPFASSDGTALHIKSGAVDHTKDWSITGQLALGWQNAAVAQNSRGALQFKIGTPVPEPASMAVLGVGLAALRRRRALRK